MSAGVRRRLRALLLVALGVLLALSAIHGLTPSSSGPDSSSYASSAGGLAGYASLLTRAGHPVARLRATPANATLDPRATLVLLDPKVIVPADITALRTFLAAGGRLIAGGREPGAWLSKLLAGAPVWTSASVSSSSPIVPVAETAGVADVESDGAGAWGTANATLPVLGKPGRSLVTVANVGSGRIVLLADSSPLQNHLLDHADNAELGLSIAGSAQRPVAFEEGVHGFGGRSGLAGLPTRWKWTLVGLLLAALLMVAARFRRLGPVQPASPPPLPPRRAHVDAIAGALARTVDPADGVRTVQRHARELALRRTGLPPDADEASTAEAAGRLGLSSIEARALTVNTLSDDDVLAAGSALAKLSGTAR
jgi:Domain of unknown function (DUF4350)